MSLLERANGLVRGGAQCSSASPQNKSLVAQNKALGADSKLNGKQIARLQIHPKNSRSWCSSKMKKKKTETIVKYSPGQVVLVSVSISFFIGLTLIALHCPN